MKILMVCLGNICRSPLAEGIMRAKIEQSGLTWTVDSAGTGGWHAGEAPDIRSVQVAQEHGIDIRGQRARQLTADDLEHFDHILVMDGSNFTSVVKMAAAHQEPKVAMIMNYVAPARNQAVPDPYYGGPGGFKQVFDMLDQACEAFIRHHLSR